LRAPVLQAPVLQALLLQALLLQAPVLRAPILQAPIFLPHTRITASDASGDGAEKLGDGCGTRSDRGWHGMQTLARDRLLFGSNRRNFEFVRQQRGGAFKRLQPCLGMVSCIVSRIGSGLRHRSHRPSHRGHRVGRNHELVGIGEFRLPDATAAVATHLAGPASGRPQGCHLDAIRCTAVRTGDEHRRLGRRGSSARLQSVR
jgi:hypothetical protein